MSATRWLLRSFGAALVLLFAAAAAAPLAADDPPKPVDLNDPPRDYEEVKVLHWTVWVEREIGGKDPELRRAALARLEWKLREALEILPPVSHPTLKGLKIFLLLGIEAERGGKDNGLEYFQRIAPEHWRNLDPRMGSSVVIYSARNWAGLSEFWALKALVHEFAHAWQLERLPEDSQPILGAWKAAMEKRLYRSLRKDDGSTIERGYAAANQLEYFAELSDMYFTGCDYFPFNRSELQAYDPEGFAMVRALWEPGAREPTGRQGPARGRVRRL